MKPINWDARRPKKFTTLHRIDKRTDLDLEREKLEDEECQRHENKKLFKKDWDRTAQ